MRFLALLLIWIGGLIAATIPVVMWLGMVVNPNPRPVTFASAAAIVLIYSAPFVMGIILYRVSESGKLPPAK